MKRAALFGMVVALGLFAAQDAHAQKLPAPNRPAGWEALSTVSMAVGMGSQIIMPRLYWSDSEVTIGTKARWHASVLAPTMLEITLGLFNEVVVHDAVTSYRPGCGPTNEGVKGCTTFGFPSTHTFVAFSALGNGLGVAAIDTFKWSGGRISGGAIAGDVALPLIAAGLTMAGRVAGSPAQEHADSALVGGVIGLAFGIVAGGAYAYFQRPECPYGAGVICW